MIWQRTWRILEILGLATELAQVAHAIPDSTLGTSLSDPFDPFLTTLLE